MSKLVEILTNKKDIMKHKVTFLSALFLLFAGYSNAQDRIPWIINNGDTLWYKAYMEDDGSRYAMIVAPSPDGNGYNSWNGKPSGHICIPDSLPMPWWWCDTTGWEDGTEDGFLRNWRENAPRIPVLRIGSDAFRDCSDIISVVIPQTVKKIYAGVFLSCTGLTNVIIGESVEVIGGSSFRNCTSLTSIVSKAEIPPICSSNPFENVPRYADVIVPCGAAYRYELSDYWNEFPRITEDCDGIDNVETLPDIKINVINSCIYVVGVNESTFDVYDISGRMVASVRHGSNTHTLPNGIYMVRIGASPARKVVVIR